MLIVGAMSKYVGKSDIPRISRDFKPHTLEGVVRLRQIAKYQIYERVLPIFDVWYGKILQHPLPKSPVNLRSVLHL
jgi:hypothetical protein